MNTLKLEIKSLEIADNNTLIGGYENSRYFDFNEAYTTKITLAPQTQYRDIVFPQITSPFALIIISNNPINVKINDCEFSNTKFIVINSNIASLQVANTSIEQADVSIFVWGQE